ncbi:MAG: glycosyltransferase [Methanocalculus sp.]|uniref:glycosyltransferase family 2 protein n=1 Tax=Methanocalculus sp. TaxID=2004547 RepID=UPI002720EF24|nr:glycosyltransferase [Methanocalculus sp.]MDO9538461.1 glycosyltransferase [Methanocalculus sp.]
MMIQTSDNLNGSAEDQEIVLSVVLPALNEEKTIEVCIQKIQQVFSDRGIAGEIIVSDSSTDKTAEISRKLGAIIVHPEKKGYGNAYLAGLALARGRYIAIGDSDNTYDFLELPKLLDALDKEGADMVMGSRLRGEILPGAMPWLHQYVGNPLLTWVLNRVFHIGISDAHSGFRIIRKDALDRLNLKTGGMEFASEMIIEAAQTGLTITEVPIHYYPRVAPSKLESFSDGWRHVRFMLFYRPGPFLAVPGLLFAIFGISMMTFFFAKGDIETSYLHSFILASLAFIGGVQTMLMGIVIWVYSALYGYSERSGFIERFLDYHTLERGFIIGGVFILGGLIIGFDIIRQWVASGYGHLFQIANAVWSLAFLLIGVQIVFSTVLISMMLLNCTSD